MDEVTLLAITGGGPRRHALLSQFERDPSVWTTEVSRKAFGEDCEAAVNGFRLRFVDYVHGESLTSRHRLEALAGDVIAEIGLDEKQLDELARLSAKARPAERRVLGCLLANLRAMRLAIEHTSLCLVIEDNVRVRRDTAAICAAALSRHRPDLLYLGHLAHEDTMTILAGNASDGVSVPPDQPRDSALSHELWGTYAYAPSLRLYRAVLSAIGDGFPTSIFHRETKRDALVTPADKLLQRAARRNHLSLLAVTPPCFFRMPPVLKSKIHCKWDIPFLKATFFQLKIYGLDWDGIWLTPEERAVVNQFRTSDYPS